MCKIRIVKKKIKINIELRYYNIQIKFSCFINEICCEIIKYLKGMLICRFSFINK